MNQETEILQEANMSLRGGNDEEAYDLYDELRHSKFARIRVETNHELTICN